MVNAVRAKALFWWSHRHTSFNLRQRKLLNRLLDAEPEGFEGGLTLRKALRLTCTSRATAWRDLVDLQALEPIGAGRSSTYRIRWPQNILANPEPGSRFARKNPEIRATPTAQHAAARPGGNGGCRG